MANFVTKSASQITVLIVEDQLNMRKIIRTVLSSMGIKNIIEAPNGSSALQELRLRNRGWMHSAAQGAEPSNAQNEVDLVIADWSMPTMTGIQLLNEIRHDQNLINLPFMMLTAENTREQIQQAFKLGVTDYIIKPFSANVLETKVRSILFPENS